MKIEARVFSDLDGLMRWMSERKMNTHDAAIMLGAALRICLSKRELAHQLIDLAYDKMPLECNHEETT